MEYAWQHVNGEWMQVETKDKVLEGASTTPQATGLWRSRRSGSDSWTEHTIQK